MRTRQAVLVEPRRFEIEECELTPGPGDLLIHMTACGLCNWELGHWTGVLGTPPMTLGHEGCGIVAEIGAGVTRFAVGDVVTGLPGSLSHFADYYIAHASHSIKISAAQGSEIVLGEPLCCVQNVVRAAHPQAGDIVAVVGCGPMGQWCIQYLAGHLPGALIAVDIDPQKLALAQTFGATHLVNPRNDEAAATVSAITAGHLADIVIEGTGSAKGVQQAIDLVTTNGTVVIMSSFKHPEMVDMVNCCTKSARVIFAHPSSHPDTADSVRRLELAINRGVFQVDPLISHTFPLADIQQAFETFDAKPAGYLKCIVIP